MQRKHRKLLAVGVGLIALMLYVSAVLLHATGDLYAFDVRARDRILHIVFGEDEASDALKNYASYAKVLPDEIKRQCLKSGFGHAGRVNESPEQMQQCVLSVIGIDRDSYFSHCNPWLFQKCEIAHINPIIANHPDLFSIVEDVFKDPCKYMLNTEKVEQLKREISQRNLEDDMVLNRLLEDMKDIKCHAYKKQNKTFILLVDGQEIHRITSYTTQ